MMRSAISSLVAAAIIYWYPSYETYKVIARRPDTEAEVEKWLIYWCVVGALAAFEASLEWLVDWVIFYYEIKVLLLVFIARGGAGFIYHGFLSQKYAQYEVEIDQHIEGIKSRTLEYFRERLQDVYAAVMRQGQKQNDRAPLPRRDVAYGEMASQLWNTYGTAALAAGTKILNNGPADTTTTTTTTSTVSNGELRFPIPDVATPSHDTLSGSPLGNDKTHRASSSSPSRR